VPVAIKGRNIEEIVAEWSSELDKHTHAFVKHASALSAWDRHILANRTALLEVEGELQAVAAGQDALERKLFMLETHQKEVHDALVSIEGEAERLLAPERGALDSDAAERDRLYARAEAVSGALLALGGELQATVSSINELSAASLGEASTPLGAIVRILNNQLQALSQVEGRVNDLGGELERLALAPPAPRAA